MYIRLGLFYARMFGNHVHVHIFMHLFHEGLYTARSNMKNFQTDIFDGTLTVMTKIYSTLSRTGASSSNAFNVIRRTPLFWSERS